MIQVQNQVMHEQKFKDPLITFPISSERRALDLEPKVYNRPRFYPPGGNIFPLVFFIGLSKKDLCEAKQNVECSKKHSKYYVLWGEGVNHSILNMNAMLCSHYSMLHFALTMLCFWRG